MVEHGQAPKEKVLDFERRPASEDGSEVRPRAEAPGFPAAQQETLNRGIGLGLDEVGFQLLDRGPIEDVEGVSRPIEPQGPNTAVVALEAPRWTIDRGSHGDHLALGL